MAAKSEGREDSWKANFEDPRLSDVGNKRWTTRTESQSRCSEVQEEVEGAWNVTGGEVGHPSMSCFPQPGKNRKSISVSPAVGKVPMTSPIRASFLPVTGLSL